MGKPDNLLPNLHSNSYTVPHPRGSSCLLTTLMSTVTGSSQVLVGDVLVSLQTFTESWKVENHLYITFLCLQDLLNYCS